MSEALYTDDDIDMANAANVEYDQCAKCGVDMPITDATRDLDNHGYLCPFCDGTFNT